MVDFFNHRAADVVQSETALIRKNQPRYLSERELSDPNRLAMPLNWIPEPDLHARCAGLVDDAMTAEASAPKWLLGWCDVTAATNERTLITCLIPLVGAAHTFPLIMSRRPARVVVLLAAVLSSFVVDFVCRQKIGGTHAAVMILKQLPVIPVDLAEAHADFIVPRVAELSCSSSDMGELATDLGYAGPMAWNEQRRAQLRAELDAYMFRLYGISRDDLDYVMETFPIVKRKDVAAHGEYRTKRMILEIYDAMAEAEANGVPYASPFDEVSAQ